MRHTIKKRQSLADIALEAGGGLESIVSLAARNGIGITDELEVGAELSYTRDDITSQDVVKRMANHKASPASAISEEDIATVPTEGIGYMAVDIDFRVG